MNKERGRVRYSVDLPVRVDAAAELLAQKRDMKKAELLRTAFKLITDLDEYTEQGYKVGAWKRLDDGSMEFIQLSF